HRSGHERTRSSPPSTRAVLGTGAVLVRASRARRARPVACPAQSLNLTPPTSHTVEEMSMPRGSCERAERPRRFLVACLTVVMATPATAVTPVTPVGVESCDAFLDAYAQCAASPGVPEAARP